MSAAIRCARKSSLVVVEARILLLITNSLIRHRTGVQLALICQNVWPASATSDRERKHRLRSTLCPVKRHSRHRSTVLFSGEKRAERRFCFDHVRAERRRDICSAAAADYWSADHVSVRTVVISASPGFSKTCERVYASRDE